MSISVALVRKLDTVAPELRDVLLQLFDELEQHREASVTKIEFNELKEIVRDLAQSQARTGQRMEELTQAQAGWRNSPRPKPAPSSGWRNSPRLRPAPSSGSIP